MSLLRKQQAQQRPPAVARHGKGQQRTDADAHIIVDKSPSPGPNSTTPTRQPRPPGSTGTTTCTIWNATNSSAPAAAAAGNKGLSAAPVTSGVPDCQPHSADQHAQSPFPQTDTARSAGLLYALCSCRSPPGHSARCAGRSAPDRCPPPGWANSLSGIICSAHAAARLLRERSGAVSGMGTKRPPACCMKLRKVPRNCQPFSPSRMTPLQTGVRTAQCWHAGCQGLYIGQSLGLAGGGTDEQVAQLIPLRHLLRAAPCRQRPRWGARRPTIRGPPAPAGARSGAIPHQQQRHRPGLPWPPGSCSSSSRFFSAASRPTDTSTSILPQGCPAPASRLARHPGTGGLPETAQVDAAGHHEHRRPRHRSPGAVVRTLPVGAIMQSVLGCHPPGQRRHRPPAPADAGRKVVGIVLIHRVVGVDQGDIQLLLRCGGPGKRC